MGQPFDADEALNNLRTMGNLTATFQKAPLDSFSITSPRDPVYNCVAWAMNDTTAWWEPEEIEDNPRYWPDGVPTTGTVDSYIMAFETRGFSKCDHGDHEDGFIKIAVYTLLNRFTHVARYENGVWHSKLGSKFDIEHSTKEFFDQSCQNYGSPTIFMRKPV